jgi:hypothetical protein
MANGWWCQGGLVVSIIETHPIDPISKLPKTRQMLVYSQAMVTAE